MPAALSQLWHRLSAPAEAVKALAPKVDAKAETAPLAIVAEVIEPVVADSALISARLDPVAISQRSEDAFTPETAPDTAPAANHHPGIVLVLVLIVVCAVLGGAMWWKLNNAQLGKVLVQPQPKMAAPVAKTPAASAATTPATPS